ncbi:nucleotidyltransferase family protein [Sphingobacteriales bacterium CHB3]|nr:nucleotidyltransferase family protein [Sphingobacteriales bacterium CHB3]
MAPQVQYIAEKIRPVLRKHQIKKAGVFGSLARGEEAESSDIDVLVELPPNLSLLDFVGIKLELEEVLGKNVDLVEYEAIKPRIRQRIISEEVPIL